MVDFFISLFLATLITALFTSRLYRLLGWYALNSLTLGIIALLYGEILDDGVMLISGSLTILLKAILLPLILKYISRKFELTRAITPRISIHYAIILVPTILVFTFYLTEPLRAVMQGSSNYIAIAIASMFLSLIIMIEHEYTAPKIIGFLMMENSLFLLSVTATGGMPMMIELGIFFDLLMAIVVINLLFKKEDEGAGNA